MKAKQEEVLNLLGVAGIDFYSVKRCHLDLK